MSEKLTFRKLRADEIEVRVKSVSEKGASALIYKTARTDMDILDETVGSERWYNDYKEIKGNLFCGICVDGVMKWDCGVESRDDGEGNEKKGEASDSFKRAGFRWGIGRELYTAPFIWLSVKTEKNQKGSYIVSDYATFSVKSIDYDGNRISKLEICDDKTGKTVYTFPRSESKPKNVTPETPDHSGEETDNPSEFVEAEEAKLRKIIIDLGKSVGRDEAKVRMFAEEIVELALKRFVKFDDMDVGTLTKVKVELAKKIAGK